MREHISKNQKYYINAVKKYNRDINFYDIETFMINNDLEFESDKDTTIYITSVTVIAPILMSYVMYILNNARKMNLKVLYFLSRDGYILFKIAKMLCDKYNIQIECKYLYVSRLVLRQPLYYIDKNEAINYLCEFSNRVTPEIILKRAGISKEHYVNILNGEKQDRILNKDELALFGKKLMSNKLFDKEAYKYAQSKFELISKYFIQEGIGTSGQYAIVDVGWMGSMQRHITTILSKMNLKSKITGYYFGMFKDADYSNGNYECFYFSKNKNVNYRAFFNNNLFECMCSANHGMTIGYYYGDNNRILPILNEFSDEWNTQLQLDTIERFAETYCKRNDICNIDEDILVKIVKKLSIRFMMFPNEKEAKCYGSFPFCDDPTESYKLSLAEILTQKELFQYNIAYKIYRNLLSKNKFNESNKTFWINGSIQLSNVKLKKIFNLFCVLSEYIHYLRIK